MKIPFDKIPLVNKVSRVFHNNPVVSFVIMVSLAVILAFLVFTGGEETRKIGKSMKTVEDKKDENKDVGVLVGKVDAKSYVSRIEKQYYDITSKFDTLNERLGTMEKDALDLRKNQADVSKIIMDLDKRVADKLGGGSALQAQDAVFGPVSTREQARQAMSLEMARVGEIKPDEKEAKRRSAYLPLGSFVKCTLLTGVYAPVNENNPLPVLFSVDEAFYGPNNTKIPLKGAFAIGKAVGDVVSKRAIIQIVSLSTVLPDGKVFEREANIGYLADDDGHLGIQGEVIYNTGRQMGLDFLSGFLAGGAEALSQAETSAVVGAYGQTSRNVTVNTGRYAMFSGLAKSAEGMSGYYQKQLEMMIPAVKIGSGKRAVFVVQKGVEIEGLEVNPDNFDYIDD
ncbi:MAG: TraB/VirB10 family protein [bacterium]|nr:TraB/VirB10 family protein [bacterium]